MKTTARNTNPIQNPASGIQHLPTPRSPRLRVKPCSTAPLTAGQNAPSDDNPSTWLAGATPLGARMRAFNRWRERFNPLRGLDMPRATQLLEQWQRGEFADPAWTYYFIEGTDPDLFALVERRTSALLELDWNIKSAPKKSRGKAAKNISSFRFQVSGFDAALAAEQTSALQEAYDSIDNLYEAIEHLASSSFRGFAHCEKYRDASGDTFHLELVDQWNICRDLLRGPWRYNPDALSTTYYALGPQMDIDPANFLIRETRRHIDRVALVKFIRSNLSQKDWDAFIDIYGLPSGVIIGPPNVPTGREAGYQEAAHHISGGGSGYLPNGANYIQNQSPRGPQPFQPHLDYLSQKLILAGTGGLLTMLAQPGSGTLAGSVHQETFNTIARAEARRISEIFQRQFDTEVLDTKFPGRPHLAWFEIAQNDELDPDKVARHALTLRQAGCKIDTAQLSEKTGYQLTDAPIERITILEAENKVTQPQPYRSY